MKKDEMTEKNEMLLHELDGLVNDIKEGIWSGGDELEQVAQSIQTEMEHVETVLDKLAQEMAVSRTGIQELAAREAESQAGLREQTDQGNGCLPAVEAAYKTVLEDQVQLAVAKERDFYLQRNYGELQARLAELRERKSQMAALTSRMGRLVDNVRCMVELADKVQALVQSQSFGFKVIMAQEEERRRVAREMHDGPAQAMANVIFLAEVCEKLIELDTGRAKEELHELRQQILGCLNETRKIIFDLRPMALDDLGLIPTVKRIADILKERKGIKVSVKPLGHAEKLESHIEIGLFR
ncbi:histidine kinase, partial [Lucifera butyrica]